MGATLLGVPLVRAAASGGVSPCWCCVMDALRQGTQAACWPASALAAAACMCGGRQAVGAAS
jgi:hypothetical protein